MTLHITIYIIKVDKGEAKSMKIISKLLPASKMKLVISSIGVLALVIFSSLVIMEATKAEVIVMNDGEKETVKTHANRVDGLLNEVGIVVGQHDKISHTGDTEIKDGMKVTYEEATKVIVVMDDQEQNFLTTVDTIGEFLEEKNLALTKHDDVSHKKNEPIVDGLKLTIAKAFQVAIKVDGKKQQVWTTGGTVEQLLKSNNIKLKDQDKVKPAQSKQANSDTPITVVRVVKKEDVVKEAIAFKTMEKEDSSLSKGEKEVRSQGEDGTVIKTYEVTKENGKEVDRKLMDKKVVESKAKVVAIGTKEPEERRDLVTLASTENKDTKQESKPEPKSEKSSTPKSNGKVIYMMASGYSANCSGCSGITATGINLHANPNANVVAVDPNVISLGTHVYIEGYGEYVAADIGGAIRGNRIDIHVPTQSAADAFGLRKVKVTILN